MAPIDSPFSWLADKTTLLWIQGHHRKAGTEETDACAKQAAAFSQGSLNPKSIWLLRTICFHVTNLVKVIVLIPRISIILQVYTKTHWVASTHANHGLERLPKSKEVCYSIA